MYIIIGYQEEPAEAEVVEIQVLPWEYLQQRYLNLRMLPRNGVSSSIQVLRCNHCMHLIRSRSVIFLNAIFLNALVASELFFFFPSFESPFTELSHILGIFPDGGLRKILLLAVFLLQ